MSMPSKIWCEDRREENRFAYPSLMTHVYQQKTERISTPSGRSS